MIFYRCSRLHTAIGMTPQKKRIMKKCVKPSLLLFAILILLLRISKKYIFFCTLLTVWMNLDQRQYSMQNGILCNPNNMLSCTCVPFRCESFNSHIRSHNIFGNKQAPSRDIAHRFAVLEHIRFTCSSKRYVNQCCTW